MAQSVFEQLFPETLADFPPGCNLPSTRTVMQVFFYHTRVGRKTVLDSARATARSVRALWVDSNKAVVNEDTCVRRIRQLYKSYEYLRQNQYLGGKTFDFKLEAFKTIADQLFNIGKAGGPTPTRRLKRRVALLAKGRQRRKKVKRRTSSNLKKGGSDSDSSRGAEDDCYELSSGCDTDEPEKKSFESSLGPINQDELMYSLDRAKISSRAGFRTLATFSKVFKLDIRAMRISRSSLSRKRKSARDKLCMQIRSSFKPNVPLTVHWDGITVKALQGRRKVERLPVIVTGKGTNQMLGGHIIHSSKGETQSAMILRNLGEWGCAEQVCSLCSDTTGSNTGYKSGCAVLLEKALGRKVLYLPCRHHVLELIPKHLFEELVEKSTSPDLGTICTNFEKTWSQIDQTNYSPGTDDEELARLLTPETVSEIVSNAKNRLMLPQIRADYKYLLELVIIFLGEVPPNGVHFRPPIALSSARFMGRIIYSLTIYMFARAGQFAVEPQALMGLREINCFVVTTYLEPWYTANDAASAPLTDLTLLQNIICYSAVSPDTADIALKAFKNHFWYLADERVALSFFDDRVDSETKREMVKKLDTPRKQTPKCRMRFIADKNTDVAFLLNATLPYFVSKNSRDFFTMLRIDTDFLLQDPEEWPQLPSYQAGLATVRALHVTNDIAERGVALIKEYNGQVTSDENEFQKVLLVCRKMISEDSNEKRNISAYLTEK